MSPVSHRLAVGGVVIDDDGPTCRVLLVQRRDPPAAGGWSLPGGKVRPHESLAEALVREMREECGLTVEPGPVCDVVELTHGNVRYVIVDYLCHVRDGTLAAGDDAAAARMVAIDDVSSYGVTEAVRKVIAIARALSRRL